MDDKYAAYTMMIERKKFNKDTRQWEAQPPQPYRTVDGRCMEAKDKAGKEVYHILTWVNTLDDRVVLPSDNDHPPILVSPHTCVALYRDEAGRLFTGTSSLTGVGGGEESAIENGETSAVGRALGVAGIGIIPGQGGIASADEMKRIAEQPAAKKPAPIQKPATLAESSTPQDIDAARAFVVTFGKYTGNTLGEIFDKDANYVSWLGMKAQMTTDKGQEAQQLARVLLHIKPSEPPAQEAAVDDNTTAFWAYANKKGVDREEALGYVPKGDYVKGLENLKKMYP